MKKKETQLMDIYFTEAPSYMVRHEVLNNTSYVVVPVVMMVQGVHSGSHGPILHLSSELGKIPESWDGIPVTVGHPQVDGEYVSANSPQVLSDWAIGQVFNTYMEDDKLRAEAWLIEERLTQLSPEILQRISDGVIIEVSVGVFSDEERVEGVFNNENYNAIARNHRPNHLALLPGEVGACSIVDGCGIRVNKQGGTKKMEIIVNETNEQQVLKELSAKGFSVNKVGFYDLASKAQNAINNLDNGTSYHYLEEIYDDYLVYRASVYNNGNYTMKYFKQSYQQNAADEVELKGEAVHVKRVVDYPVVPTVNSEGHVKRSRKYFNNNKEEQNMANECTACVKAAVDALIANKATAYTNKDRDWLEALSEEQLEKMNPVVVEKTIEVNKVPKTTEEFLAGMPAEVREQYESGLRLHTAQKTKMVTTITANQESPWTKEELEAMPFATLEKVYKTVTANSSVENEVQNYALMGGGAGFRTNGAKHIEVMAPVGVTFDEN